MKIGAQTRPGCVQLCPPKTDLPYQNPETCPQPTHNASEWMDSPTTTSSEGLSQLDSSAKGARPDLHSEMGKFNMLKSNSGLGAKQASQSLQDAKEKRTNSDGVFAARSYVCRGKHKRV
jgi:hypothetical protein